MYISSKIIHTEKDILKRKRHNTREPQTFQQQTLLDKYRKIDTLTLGICNNGTSSQVRLTSLHLDSEQIPNSIRLPFEILLRIFEQLHLNDILNCACICRSWYRVTLYADLYGHLVFDLSRFRKAPDPLIARIINRATHRIHSLELHRLSFSHRLTTSISSDIYRHLKCLKLVGGHSKTSGRGLNPLLGLCQDQLNHIELEHIQLDSEATRILWNRFSRLVYLRLSHVDMETNIMLQSGPPVWRELRDCIIENDTSWTSTSIMYLVQIASFLVQLRLIQCERVTSDIIYSLASLCSHLTQLSLVGLASNQQSIIRTDSNATTPMMLPPLLSSTTTSSSNMECTLEAGFLTLAYSNPSLIEIHLQGWSTCLSNRVIEHLVTLCQDLRIVDLGSAPHLTDIALADLGLYCPHLEVFQVQDVHAITPVGLFNFSHHCLQLRRLHLDRCAIDDISLKLIASSLIKLRYLSLDQAQITGSVLVEALCLLKKLKWLSINVCPMITNNVLAKIRYEFPRLRLVAQLLSVDES